MGGTKVTNQTIHALLETHTHQDKEHFDRIFIALDKQQELVSELRISTQNLKDGIGDIRMAVEHIMKSAADKDAKVALLELEFTKALAKTAGGWKVMTVISVIAVTAVQLAIHWYKG